MFSKLIESSEQAPSIARIFSPQILSDLSRKGRSEHLSLLLRDLRVTDGGESGATLKGVFDSAFAVLNKKEFRNEYVYKSALAHKLLLGTHSLKTAAMLTEFRVQSSKADVVILNGTSTVYEIKSERDNLDKLKRQIGDYRKAFACVNVITGENHLSDVIKNIDEDVGVLLLSGRGQISTIREGMNRPERVIPKVIFDSIQIRESKLILDALGKEIPSVPNTRIYKALEDEFSKQEPNLIHEKMIKVLKRTRSHLPLDYLISSLPKSLTSLTLSTKIRKQDHDRLIEAMDITVNNALSWSE